MGSGSLPTLPGACTSMTTRAVSMWLAISSIVVRGPVCTCIMEETTISGIISSWDNGPQQYEYSGWTRNHSYWKDHLPTMIQGYERVASSPAWKAMRNMNIHPRDAVLPDGLIMSGNEFTRNIVAYRGADAALVRTNDVPFDHNVADFNLVWHHGLPVKTGRRRPGKELSGKPAPNGDFNAGIARRLPRGLAMADQDPVGRGGGWSRRAGKGP